MRRYLLYSLAMGVLVTAMVLALYFLRVFEPAALWLGDFFRARAFFPGGGEPQRLVWAEITAITLVSLWACWCLSDLPQAAQRFIIFLVFAFVILGIAPTLALYGILFEPFSSMLALFLATSAAFVLSGTELGTRRRTLEAVLGNRVSPSTFRELMDSPSPPAFEGSARSATVLTCELFEPGRGTERLEPGDLLKMTNLFRRVVANFLASKGAYIDESGPDEVRAFFGLLRPDRDHAANAARAALDLRSCFRTLNQEFQSRWYVDLECGAGLSSGTVVSGIYGSKDHFFLSGTGEAVEFSRRLARANRRYGSDLMLGPQIVGQIQELVEVRPLEMFFDPETGGITEVYQLLGLTESFSEENRAVRNIFWDGVIKYREGAYEEALKCFSRARATGNEDPPLEYFIRRTQEKMSGSGPDLEEELTGRGHARLIEQL